jgi:hypothetical protein
METSVDLDSLTDDDSGHSLGSFSDFTTSGDSSLSLDFESFSSQMMGRRRVRNSSGGTSGESGIMSPESIAMDDEETLMTPPDIFSSMREKQNSGGSNVDDGFNDELESLSPGKLASAPTSIFSLLNAPIISKDSRCGVGLLEDSAPSRFTQIRRRPSPVRQLRAESCPCPFSPVVEEDVPLFNLDCNSQPSPFTTAGTTLSAQPEVNQVSSF